ncbi:arylalkylamine N-acetyltransferase 1-like [Diorhabda carinulata]|uniref:arylalkylamine N-acetyltransferase 1-like n=1 Tax=Diorhabda carinulata TaxID=1163345 RepID=UPI0025A0F98C|nr:arylalkylamine N-acetyltransferase 1-like [Diorhabda carinulata]
MALQYPKTFQIQEKFEKLSFRYGNQISEDSAISSCSTPSTPTSPIDFDIKIATLDDEQQVLEFLQKFFYKDEPLNAFMELITDEHPRCLDLEKFTLKDLDNGVNLLAIQNGKIIGVCLNGIIERDSNEDEFVSKDEKFSKIVKLLDYVAVESDPFQIYPGIDRAMVVKILSVDNSYRGKGIAKYLIAKTREIARYEGCGFISVDCTSHYTACAAKKLGFDLHYTLNYEDYKIDGKVVFKPEPPHKSVTVYTQRIY